MKYENNMMNNIWSDARANDVDDLIFNCEATTSFDVKDFRSDR